MGRKLAGIAVVVALAIPTAALAKPANYEGEFKRHPDSVVTAKLQVRNGAPTLLKRFEFSGLVADCEDGTAVEVAGDTNEPAELERRGNKYRFETEIGEGASALEVVGKVSASGRKIKGRAEYETKARGGCEAEARFVLKR
jgi:hypothetical protein